MPDLPWSLGSGVEPRNPCASRVVKRAGEGVIERRPEGEKVNPGYHPVTFSKPAKRGKSEHKRSPGHRSTVKSSPDEQVALVRRRQARYYRTSRPGALRKPAYNPGYMPSRALPAGFSVAYPCALVG